MRFSDISLLFVLLAFAGPGFARPDNNDDDDNNDNNGSDSNGSELFLDQNNVQTGSQSDGLDSSAEDGQAASNTDNANFINFCSGQTLTNGQQVTQGSCNGIVMGQIPSQDAMVSSIIVNPQPGQDMDENTDFTVDVQTANLAAGSFTNPDNTYYAAPQTVENGQVVGHTHITIQDMGGTMTPSQALDATQFVFFKGINDAGNGQGLLSATVEGGLSAGTYRVCTMSSASNHQPVLMPIAQRGAQDDCTKFTVGQGNSNSDSSSDDNSDDSSDDNDDDSNNDSTNTNSNNGFGGNGFGGNGFGGNGFGGFGRRRKFTERAFIA